VLLQGGGKAFQGRALHEGGAHQKVARRGEHHAVGGSLVQEQKLA
jgi:hypothetical protein